MADWSILQNGLTSGFAIGQQAGGSGLGSIIEKVAAELKSQRQSKEALNLLGQTEGMKAGISGLVKGEIAPAQVTDTRTINIPGMQGKYKQIEKDLPVYKTAADGSVVQVGTMKKGGKLQGMGMGAASVAFSKEMAPEIADSIMQGDIAGYLNSDARTRTAVAYILSQKGISINEKTLGYKANQSMMNNARIQDQKVNAGISAQTLLNSSFDQKTGEWKVPPSMHSELALSVGRMLSQVGVVPFELVESLRQKTAREQFAGMAIYLGADPSEVGGSTQSVIKLFAKTIHRETVASQEMRGNYSQGQTSNIEDFMGKTTRGMVTIQDITGKTIRIPRQDAVSKGYINE